MNALGNALALDTRIENSTLITWWAKILDLQRAKLEAVELILTEEQESDLAILDRDDYMTRAYWDVKNFCIAIDKYEKEGNIKMLDLIIQKADGKLAILDWYAVNCAYKHAIKRLKKGTKT